MSEYGTGDYPGPGSDHGRVVTSGAWLGALAFCSLTGWADWHLPHLAAWLLNWTVILAVCYAMAVWKRAWYAWAAFWGMAALCVVGGIAELLGLLTSQWSTWSWVIGCAMVFVWYWLVRIPRLHPPAPPQVTHVVHHHVLHHPDGRAVEVGQSGTVPGELDVTAWPAVGQRHPIALENLASRPGIFPGRRGELAVRLREVIRRRTGQ